MVLGLLQCRLDGVGEPVEAGQEGATQPTPEERAREQAEAAEADVGVDVELGRVARRSETVGDREVEESVALMDDDGVAVDGALVVSRACDKEITHPVDGGVHLAGRGHAHPTSVRSTGVSARASIPRRALTDNAGFGSAPPFWR